MAWGAVRGYIKEPTSMGRHSPRVTTARNLLARAMTGLSTKGEHVALHRQPQGILEQPHNYSMGWQISPSCSTGSYPSFSPAIIQ